jgi:hypothetical protein
VSHLERARLPFFVFSPFRLPVKSTAHLTVALSC